MIYQVETAQLLGAGNRIFSATNIHCLSLLLYEAQKLCTYLRSANAVIIELWATVAAKKSPHPRHPVSFFCNVTRIQYM